MRSRSRRSRRIRGGVPCSVPWDLPRALDPHPNSTLPPGRRRSSGLYARCLRVGGPLRGEVPPCSHDPGSGCTGTSSRSSRISPFARRRSHRSRPPTKRRCSSSPTPTRIPKCRCPGCGWRRRFPPAMTRRSDSAGSRARPRSWALVDRIAPRRTPPVPSDERRFAAAVYPRFLPAGLAGGAGRPRRAVRRRRPDRRVGGARPVRVVPASKRRRRLRRRRRLDGRVRRRAAGSPAPAARRCSPCATAASRPRASDSRA